MLTIRKGRLAVVTTALAVGATAGLARAGAGSLAVALGAVAISIVGIAPVWATFRSEDLAGRHRRIRRGRAVVAAVWWLLLAIKGISRLAHGQLELDADIVFTATAATLLSVLLLATRREGPMEHPRTSPR